MNTRHISKIMIGALLGTFGTTLSCSGDSKCDGPGGLCVSPNNGGSPDDGGAAGDKPDNKAGSKALGGGGSGGTPAHTAAGGGAHDGAGGDLVVQPPVIGGAGGAGGAGGDGVVGHGGDGPVQPTPCSPVAPHTGQTCAGPPTGPAVCTYEAESCTCLSGGWSCSEIAHPTCVHRMASAMLVDDFEDNDSETFPIFDGDLPVFWYTFNDGTGEQPEFVGPTSPGAGASLHAARTLGSGFMLWGGGLAISLNQLQVDCPVDLSATAGLRFKAKGHGNVRLTLPTTETSSPANGGHCTLASGCDFAPFYPLALTDEWQQFSVPWQLINPGGAAFDPYEALAIQFQATDDAYPAAAPIDFDFWVDDVELYDDSGAGGAGGPGGAGAGGAGP